MAAKTLNEFAEEVMDLMPHIIRNILKTQSDALKKGIITIPQYLALDLLHNQKPLKMKEIAKELNISLPATTGLIGRLYTIKMVERIYDINDRRVIYIKITPKGINIVKEIRAQRQHAIEGIFCKLTTEERLSYLNVLKKMKTVLQA